MATVGPFVGRDRELHELLAAPGITLLGGDAGVGKTRLLRELAAATSDRVLVGHCLDLGESSAPYLPWSEMWGRLAQSEPETVDELVGRRPLLGSLLSGYDVATSAPVRGDAGPAALYDAVHAGLESLAAHAPITVIVEDLHWADRSTRDLLTVLFTRQFEGPVRLVASYRADDLHRRHPLRRILGEWTRLPGVERLVLEPLRDDDIHHLATSLRPSITTDQVDMVLAQSGGNPFFVEELLAVDRTNGTGVPEDLADLLLVRVDALSDDARTVVRAVSAAGRSVGHARLAAVVPLSAAGLEVALTSLVDHNLLEARGTDSYTFRHALLAEAVYDDLLPGERVRWHSAYVDALASADELGAAADLAHHARAAGQHEVAAQAAVRAGDEAMRAVGPADAARLYEDALAILAQHPDVTPPISLAQVAARTSAALLAAGDPYRAAQTAREALTVTGLAAHDYADLVIGLVTAAIGTGDPLDPTVELRHALRLLEPEGPTARAAQLHALLGRWLFFTDDFDDALAELATGRRLARDLDLPAVLLDVDTTSARIFDIRGESAAALGQLQDVAESARRAAEYDPEVRALHQVARVYTRQGRHRKALQAFEVALQRSIETRHETAIFGMDARVASAYWAVQTGDWARAERWLAAPQLQKAPYAAGQLRAVAATLAAARGDHDAALQSALALQPLWSKDVFLAVHGGAALIDVLGARGELDRMLQALDDLVEIFRATWNAPLIDARIRLSGIAIGHLATKADPAYTDDVSRLAEAAAEVAARAEALDDLGPESVAWVTRVHVGVQRFAWGGNGAAPAELIALLRTDVRQFDDLEIPLEAARARLHLARALGASGGPGAAKEAREVALAAEQAMRDLGVRSVAEPTASHPTLTAREREVLELVARGRTNGQIARELFISVKTASVHVSNIVAKLGVSNRTEAAMAASAQGLLSDTSAPG
ncbi:AAA family ATPase [Allobranchiibius sp. CTAmp26]|uniref:helix-turn-helix transcriptional regulator n=1 Tax=Allobranchiibius sp. CTAmp26 TaxID=2815214 RepID=UPI001AA1CAB0|nr:AAA family ATPase [Allobranchiibius sp. CTAmp26]MBO1756162.1 AAA family ATPase [Allobranchiibius sp. CTAmp26]